MGVDAVGAYGAYAVIALVLCWTTMGRSEESYHVVDTVHDQTIGGVKTFALPVVASVTGSAATSGSSALSGQAQADDQPLTKAQRSANLRPTCVGKYADK